MALFDFLNFLLDFPPAVGLLIISVAISLVTTLVYKYTTNQKMLKDVKADVKRMQAELRATKDPAQLAALQKEMMGKSMKQLSSSMKSTLITIVPLFLLFGWMQTHFAYSQLTPGSEFTSTAYFTNAAGPVNITLTAPGLEILNGLPQQANNGVAVWHLKGVNEGTYNLGYSFGNESYFMKALVTKQFRYDNPLLTKSNGIKKDSVLTKISIDLTQSRPFGNFSIFGYKPGWFMTYLIFSLAFSMLARKVFNVY